MKKLIYFFILTLAIISCSSDDNHIAASEGQYVFTKEYSTTVTVGGFVGIIQRTFKEGEIYQGTSEGKETVAIRIAEHTERNERCPNSWCYQEFLSVPQEYLKLVK